MKTGLMALLFTGISAALGQPSAHPRQWVLDASLSDEFESTSLDTAKWWCWSPCFFTDSIIHGYVGGQGAFFIPDNVSLSNGNVVFKVMPNPDSLNMSYPCTHSHVYPYYSGGIESVMSRPDTSIGPAGRFSFGYYEMRALLPGYYDSLGNSVGTGFDPVFWFYYQHVVGGCNVHHDEVDVLEPAGNYYDARTNVVGWHDENNMCTSYKVGQDSMRSPVPLFLGYHTYAVELLPNHITFYFDDVPFFTADSTESAAVAHSLDMSPYLTVVMSVQMGGGVAPPGPPAGTPWPQYMYVDYFRYYRYNDDTLAGNFIYPDFQNPFSGSTEMHYHLNMNVHHASLELYSLQGIRLQSYPLAARGNGTIELNCSFVSKGVYICALVTEGVTADVKKIVVVK
jgi:hypothetical protein